MCVDVSKRLAAYCCGGVEHITLHARISRNLERCNKVVAGDISAMYYIRIHICMYVKADPDV